MLIVAHRGYSAAYPENTALAFERAIAAGADFIETDVRFTRDGALVCSHDPDLRRAAGGVRAIAMLTLEELKAIRLGPRSFSGAVSPHSSDAETRRLLTLGEVLDIARGRAGVMLDVKVTTPEMVDAIAALLEHTQMTQHVIYGARTVEHLGSVVKRCPSLGILGMPANPELAAEFLEHEVKAVRYWEDEVTPARLKIARAAGCAVWVTAGLRTRQEAPGYATAARARALAEMGVDALLINDPTTVRDLLAARDGY